MKNLLQLSLLLAGAMMLNGCGKSEDTTAAGGSGGSGATAQAIDTTALSSQFATAEGAVKTAVDEAVAAVNTGRYSDAVTSLQKLASDTSLTARQKTAVSSLLESLKAKAASAGNEVQNAVKSAGDALNKTANDAAKSVGDAANKAVTDATKAVGK